MRWYLVPRNAIILLFALVLTFYLAVIPMFWGAPKAVVDKPAISRYDQDAKVAITVSAMHANVDLVQAYLVVEYPNYQELNLPASLYPISLFEASQVRQYWTSVNRISWPRSKRYEFTLPLRDLAQQGLSQPGTFQGVMHVVLNYPKVIPRRRRTYTRGYQIQTETLTMPFSMTLTE